MKKKRKQNSESVSCVAAPPGLGRTERNTGVHVCLSVYAAGIGSRDNRVPVGRPRLTTHPSRRCFTTEEQK